MTIVVDHECEMLSTCCAVGAAEGTELEDTTDDGVRIGFCGSCHDHADFECNECEYGSDAPIDAEVILSPPVYVSTSHPKGWTPVFGQGRQS